MKFDRFLMRNRHASVWYARVYIPRHLQPCFGGQKEFRKSTQCMNKGQAGRLALQFWVECQALFEQVECNVGKKKNTDTIQIGYATTTDMLGKTHTFDFGGDKDPIGAAKEQESVRQVQQAAAATIERYKDNPELIKALISANSSNQKQVTTSPRISEVVEGFLSDRARGRGIRPATADGYRQFVQAFIVVVGDMRVGEVSYDHATEFRDRLFSYPKNRNKSKSYRDKTEAELAAMTIPKDDCLNGHTINNHIGHLKVLFGWLESKRTIERNPFKGVAVAYSAESYAEYSAGDLERIFSSPLWQSGSSYASRASTSAATWWAPLLALYTGARPTEIVQMRLEDIQVVDDILMAAVVDDEEKGQQVKSKAGLRSFPIHPRLLELGFSEYVEALRGTGATRVLQGIKPAPRLPGANLGKWWNERYRMENFPEFKAQHKVFYSFRHTYFTKALHYADIKLEYVQQMCGHESSHMGATASYDKGAGAARLFSEVSKVEFQSESLNALSDSWRRMPLFR